MSSITITKARQTFYNLVKAVNENVEAITVVNSKGENAVLMSEEEYENIQETLYFLENHSMAKILIEGKNTSLEECVDFNGWKNV